MLEINIGAKNNLFPIGSHLILPSPNIGIKSGFSSTGHINVLI